MSSINPNFEVRRYSITNTPTLVKSGLTELWGWNIINANAAIAYVQLFDIPSTTAPGFVLGTTIPTRVIVVPTGAGSFSFQSFLEENHPTFKNGLVIAVTTTETNSIALGSAISLYLDVE